MAKIAKLLLIFFVRAVVGEFQKLLKTGYFVSNQCRYLKSAACPCLPLDINGLYFTQEGAAYK